MGFCQFACDFPNFRNLSKTFLRYSQKVVSSFVRTPSFVSDWLWFLKFRWKSKKSMYYSTWVFVNLVAIFRIFETCPKRSLGTPKKLWVVSSEPHASFQIDSNFKNFDKNQRNPCTIVHGFFQFGCNFPNFRNLSKTFLRYSRKVVSSFVRTPSFVSDWQWF